ncbi:MULTISPECIES: dethiobiotin synthase [unclassified Aureispira]|uniref:dethiobiotin synthase n=1 Tax=unclassified Aureispira TaxID=2649989 RepID=UPI000696BE0D|nr:MULTISPECIES: dethiobiotin synthase [unclassified Aureispira]WMX16379.1 dethiobiotin synthase [Aureispira sp. CCB-E]
MQTPSIKPNQSKQYFVTGIDTDVGKTIVSAVLVEALQADYWKPVQAGGLDFTDTNAVQELVSNPTSHFFEEAYRLNTPASPHYAAEVDQLTIDFHSIKIPDTKHNLIIEGAGGLFVPLNDDFLIIDLIQRFNVPVVLVAKFYLGSINHTLSSIDALQKRNIPIAGIIFNGPITESSKKYILNYTKIPCLGCIPWLDNFSKKEVVKYAKTVRNLLL